jgi:hypothetical protein
VIEIAFAISPLLALSTTGWASASSNSVYLLRVSLIYVILCWLFMMRKVFNSLGNERPEILIQLEDCVLVGIISISEGVPREEAMHTLYSQMSSMKLDLAKDEKALSWFNLSSQSLATSSNSTTSECPSTPLPRGVPEDLPINLKERFQGG